MIDFGDDLDEMLDPDDFGVVFTYSGTQYDGILSQEYFEADVGRAGVEGFQPVLYTKENVTFTHGSTLTIDGRGYRVVNIEPSNTELQVVMLHAL